MGDPTHTVFRLLKNYWEGIQKELFTILNSDLPFDPTLLYDMDTPKGSVGKSCIY